MKSWTDFRIFSPSRETGLIRRPEAQLSRLYFLHDAGNVEEFLLVRCINPKHIRKLWWPPHG